MYQRCKVIMINYETVVRMHHNVVLLNISVTNSSQTLHYSFCLNIFMRIPIDFSCPFLFLLFPLLFINAVTFNQESHGGRFGTKTHGDHQSVKKLVALAVLKIFNGIFLLKQTRSIKHHFSPKSI